METLVAVAQYGNGRNGNNPIRFRDINCRTFEYGSGLLPSPFKSYHCTPKKTPCGNNGVNSKSDDGKNSKKSFKSSPIAINLKGGGKERYSRENFSLSELWAGPAYSNSPPPSSLPIPSFSAKPKRTVSLELPKMESDLNFQPMAKSAPASPTRGSVDFLRNDEFATMTLRRILNLDIADD